MTESFFDSHAFQKGDRVKLPDGNIVQIYEIDFEHREIKVRGVVSNTISFYCEDVELVK